jgi:hypothetical protein
MRSLATAAALAALLTAPSYAQGVLGSPGVSSPDGGSGQKGRHGAGRAGSEQKSTPQPPKVDQKAYHSALDNLPDKKFDPWRNMR